MSRMFITLISFIVARFVKVLHMFIEFQLSIARKMMDWLIEKNNIPPHQDDGLN